MICKIKIKTFLILCIIFFICFLSFLFYKTLSSSTIASSDENSFIKWVDFKVSDKAMEKAIQADINSLDEEVKLNWIELLSFLAVKYGGDFKRYNPKDMDLLIKNLNDGKTLESLITNKKTYDYYFESYTAVLGGFVGPYEIEIDDKDNPGSKIWVRKYGLKAFSPIASGYYYNDYDDFGNSRSYGFKRLHLGHDMMGSVGTPIIAVETGRIEALGWNQYGGWRIGIRSLDNKRYYYYAHLRKDHPYVNSLKEGDIVYAGDVIGYLGMSGYSTKENVNNIDTPHLHFGMQLVFDESQKEALAEIWIDVYDIVKILSRNKSAVSYNKDTKEFYRTYNIKFHDSNK